MIVGVKNNKDTFYSNRIKSARESKGLTIRELSEYLNVSHQMISKYENGNAIPSPEILMMLMKVLDQPFEYFYKRQENNIDGLVYYRSKANTTKKLKRLHETKISWLMEIFSDIEEIIEFPKTNIPFINTKYSHFMPTDFERIEEITLSIRREWGLNNGPITNLTRLFEKQGIIVSIIKSDDNYVDACSSWDKNNRLFILVGNDRSAPSRVKFTLAHELGHAILHKNVPESEFNKKDVYKRMEQEANYFASAFLLPAEIYSKELLGTSLDYFRMLKRRWQVSMQALVYRASELNIINQNQSSYLWKKIAKNGWKMNEPDDEYLIEENAMILREAIELIIDNNVMEKKQLRNMFAKNESDIVLLANLEYDYFLHEDKNNNIVEFKRK